MLFEPKVRKGGVIGFYTSFSHAVSFLKLMKSNILFLVMMTKGFVILASNSVTLTWDTVEGCDYVLYFGSGFRNYTNATVVGANLKTISNLVAATQYHFAVTARDTNGIESDYSADVQYVPPILDVDGGPVIPFKPRFPIQIVKRGDSVGLLFRVPQGSRVEVQYSPDLVTWYPLTQIDAPLGLVSVSDVVGYRQRFYRAKLL